MPHPLSPKSPIYKAADIVRDAGGTVVGRTKLQKIACLLEIAGLGEGFAFEYRHYGPFSQELADAIAVAHMVDLIDEEECVANWGGKYSIYSSMDTTGEMSSNQARIELLQRAVSADPIELELAVTAAFLHAQGKDMPWQETAARKPDKAQGARLERAKVLYRSFCEVATPIPLPELNG